MYFIILGIGAKKLNNVIFYIFHLVCNNHEDYKMVSKILFIILLTRPYNFQKMRLSGLFKRNKSFR